MNDFRREYDDLQVQLLPEIAAFMSRGVYVLGPDVADFESKFAAYIGCKYAVGVANGMEAIQIALLAAGVGPGDEVITVANSAVATALAVTAVGAAPVFVDIDRYHHLDPQKLARALTPRTKVILPVHLFGQVADMRQISAFARKHNLLVIEDACQAHGAMLGGKKAGSFGDLGCFSFYPTKNLGAAGDAGAITTDSKKYYDLCLKLRNYGQKSRYEHVVRGLNSRLDPLQAVILKFKLGRLDAAIAKRRQLAQIYLDELSGLTDIVLPRERPGTKHNYHLFAIETDRRDALQDYLYKNGIQTLIHYPIPIHKQGCYREFAGVSLPQTEIKSRRLLSLPIYPYLEEAEIRQVSREIKKYLQ